MSLWDTEQGTRLASSSGHTKAVRALAVGQGALQGVLVRLVHGHCMHTACTLHMGIAWALHRRCKQWWCASTFLPATRPVCAPRRRAATPPPRLRRAAAKPLLRLYHARAAPLPRHHRHDTVTPPAAQARRLLYLLWQVSGSYDLSVRLWDSATLRCVGTRLGHAREVCILAATLCNPRHPMPQVPCRKPHARHPPPPHASHAAAPCLPRPPPRGRQVFSVAAGSERIASGSVDRTICLWDGRAPGCTATLTHGGGGHQWSLAMLGEHNLFAGSGDGAVRIWDLRRTPAGDTAATSGGDAASGASGGLVACMPAESGGQQHKAGSCALALDHESGRRMASGGPSICVRQLPSQ